MLNSQPIGGDMKFRYFLAALTVGLACGNGGSGDTESASAPSVPDTVVISVVDTIGVLFGDSSGSSEAWPTWSSTGGGTSWPWTL